MKDKKLEERIQHSLNAELSGFLETDRYTVQWQYSNDNGETFQDMEGATDLTYRFTIDKENAFYAWRLVLTLLPDEEMTEPAV